MATWVDFYKYSEMFIKHQVGFIAALCDEKDLYLNELFLLAGQTGPSCMITSVQSVIHGRPTPEEEPYILGPSPPPPAPAPTKAQPSPWKLVCLNLTRGGETQPFHFQTGILPRVFLGNTDAVAFSL